MLLKLKNLKLGSFLSVVANLSALFSVYFAYQTINLAKISDRPYVSVRYKMTSISPIKQGYKLSILNIGRRPAESIKGIIYAVDIKNKEVSGVSTFDTGVEVIPGESLTYNSEINVSRKKGRYSTYIYIKYEYTDYINASRERFDHSIVFKITDLNKGSDLLLTNEKEKKEVLKIVKKDLKE